MRELTGRLWAIAGVMALSGRGAGGALLAQAGAPASPAPAATAPLMALNRAGKWAEAARLAQRYLDSIGTKDSAQACEVLYHLAYARTRLQQVGPARDALGAFDHRCGALTLPPWLGDAVKPLRAELDPGNWGRSVSASVTDGWTVADPASLGLKAEPLARHRELCLQSGADACLVVYHGAIVQEYYGPRYHEPMTTMSSVKSWVSVLAGILVTDGTLNLDDSASTYVPLWTAGARGGVTVMQLLTMTAGLGQRTADSGSKRSVGFVSTNKNAFVVSLPLDYPPGERWDYSNEGVQLLSPILQRAAGQPLPDFARRRLFEPLHMDHTTLHVDGAGVVWTYADAETTLRDFAKPCQLMLDGGRWHGRAIVPPSWVQRSTQPIPQNPQYGLLWWIVPGGFAARGYLDTSCYVFPPLGLVVARMQAKPAPDAHVPYETPALFELLRQIVGR